MCLSVKGRREVVLTSGDSANHVDIGDALARGVGMHLHLHVPLEVPSEDIMLEGLRLSEDELDDAGMTRMKVGNTRETRKKKNCFPFYIIKKTSIILNQTFPSASPFGTAPEALHLRRAVILNFTLLLYRE